MTLGRIVLLALSTVALGVVIVDLTSPPEEKGVKVSPRGVNAASDAEQVSTGVVGWANWHTDETEATPVVDESGMTVETGPEEAVVDDPEQRFNERFKGMEFARKPGRAREGGR